MWALIAPFANSWVVGLWPFAPSEQWLTSAKHRPCSCWRWAAVSGQRQHSVIAVVFLMHFLGQRSSGQWRGFVKHVAAGYSHPQTSCRRSPRWRQDQRGSWWVMTELLLPDDWWQIELMLTSLRWRAALGRWWMGTWTDMQWDWGDAWCAWSCHQFVLFLSLMYVDNR